MLGGQSQGRYSLTPSTEKWVTMSPKKRGRVLSLSRCNNGLQILSKATSLTINIISELTSPSIKIISNQPSILQPPPFAPQAATQGTMPIHDVPIVEGIPQKAPSPVTSPHLQDGTSQENPSHAQDASLSATQPAYLALLGANDSTHLQDASSASPLGDAHPEDEDIDMFFNFENKNEAHISADSTKKAKLDPPFASRLPPPRGFVEIYESGNVEEENQNFTEFQTT
ncbi:hypothetical protein Cgig2_026463 [Carnegiea gigantea]|uniref:Uncharacterized protein n=1 Tax=Carnegiea gigantea TaxID=171969 RepID=A0A9Q1GH02_9CARY|nr:hypothetical protein Cgig2_026463 [Carnegiea gigantea]